MPSVSARNTVRYCTRSDAELVREAYSPGEYDQQWQIVEDPVIQRRAAASMYRYSQIDATFDAA